jgi:multidrug efflux system membrane fusion protein
MWRKALTIGALVLGLAAVILAAVRLRANAGKPAGPEAARADRPVAVASATAVRGDVPVDLDGLGSVVAYKTVTLRAQVDGRLDKVLFREGQVVKRGELLVQIDPRPFQIALHQARGNLARDQALLAGAQLNFDRYTKLTGQKFIAQQQLDDQRGLLGQYQGAVQVDQAQVESAELNLSYTRITSPIDGVTGVRLVDPGNLVRASDTTGIVVLTQLDPIAVLFTLPQDNLPQIAKHMHGPAPLKVDAFDRDGVELLASGELLLIDNQINQTTATIRLKAVFPNPDKKLWPNQFVKARLHVAVQKDELVVPSTAVQRGPRGTYVYVIKPDQTVELRDVETDLVLRDVTVITRGLSAGEQVVIEGQNQLRPGARVQTRPKADVGPREDGHEVGKP